MAAMLADALVDKLEFELVEKKGLQLAVHLVALLDLYSAEHLVEQMAEL
jgi:hypothetical protein